MENNFDVHAENYDQDFTNSIIGKAQRDRVFHFINKQQILKNKLQILEINCGTGYDANYFSKNGHSVLATDISYEMIQVAKQKYKDSNIEFKQLDIKDISTESFTQKFDLIFSNFGGLNCLSPQELKSFLNISDSLLKSKGKMALVIMPKLCIWERFYFILKGEIRKAKRRNTNKSVLANVEGVKVPTWYYNPKEVVSLASNQYKTIAIKPIGLKIPPSYLEPFFKNIKGFLKMLIWAEELFSNRFWAKYSDHYLIIFEKK